MVRSYAWLLLAIMPLHNNILSHEESACESPDFTAISRGTHLTFRRYYFISRLDRTMSLLFKMQSSQQMSFTRALRKIDFDLSMFNDRRIIRSLKRIQETRNLKPLFMIWDDFTAYKSLEDDIFIEDFSKEIFVVVRTVLSTLDEHCDNTLCLEQLAQQSSVNPTEQLLDAIDEITHELQKVVPDNTHHYKQITHASPLDLKSEVSTDEIALRFYYIERLTSALETIKRIGASHAYHTLPHKAALKSPRIYSMLRAMQEAGNPDAVLSAWGEIKEYKFIDNLEFVKEFVSVVYLALRHLYTGANNPDILTHTHNNLEKLSIEHILHAIDIINDQLSHDTQIYNGYSTQSVQEWLQQYWWIPPFTLGSIAVRLIYYYYYGQSKS